MSSWFSCCYGSRKELPSVDPVQPKVGSTASRGSPTFRVTGMTSGSASETAVLQGTVLGYQSMSTTSFPGSSSKRSYLVRQTTEPVIRSGIASASIPEASSAPITIPAFNEGSPLERISSGASEPPDLARSFSVLSAVDPQIGMLQSQILSLQTERETFAKQNHSLELEVEQSQAKQVEAEKAREAVEAELEGARKEKIILFQRNAQLEKRLAILQEAVLRTEKEQFLQSPLSRPTERRGSLSDIEEEDDENGSKKWDRTPTLLQMQEKLAKMESKYQRATRHLKELKEKLEKLQRENNHLEMELQTNKDRVAELEFMMEKTQKNLDKRERAKSDIEKREVAVEKAEEHQAQDQVREKELEKSLQNAEETAQKLHEQATKLHIQRDEALREKERLIQKLHAQQKTLQEQEQQCKIQEKQLEKQEKMLLEEREKTHSHKAEIDTLKQKLTEATELLAGYAPPKSVSGLTRSSSLPICVAKP